ncbi:DUF3616 domain-containing protein [Noviherbaspirillum saxi]|nr:DUF3616 domain-containing protein [Noviherbaspirillum saxi]
MPPKRMRFIAKLLALAPAVFLIGQSSAQQIHTYTGLCDASAASALGKDHFVVADDERNTLVIYKLNQPEPAHSIDLSAFLGTKEDKESDIEGAAAIGKRIYWISSHGRNSSGEVQKRRYRFFATDKDEQTPTTLAPVGKPYTTLLDDLIAAPELKKYRIADAASRAPEAEGGLNIEGLTAMPYGGLLIGFRNPIPGNLALIVPIKNPAEMIKGTKPQFGKPIELALGGRGIRSIERVGKEFMIVAGPPADDGSFMLYRWSGKADDKAQAIPGIEVSGLFPEALIAVPNSTQTLLLSDDGGVKSRGVACKNKEKSKQSFRARIVEQK